MRDDRLRLAAVFMKHVRRPRMTNKEIAEELGVNVTKVSRLLSDAEERNFLSQYLNVPRHELLENRLEEHFKACGLIEARVAQAWSGLGRSELRRIVAHAAARYFEEWERERGKPFRVGVSGGLTMYETIRALRPPDRDHPDVTVHALVGTPIGEVAVSANGIASLLCARYGLAPAEGGVEAKVVGYELPFAFESRRQKAAALRRGQVRLAYRGAFQVNWAFIGVGALEEADGETTIGRILDELGVTVSSLLQMGAVAEVLGACLDRDGNLIHTPVEDRILAVPLDRLRTLSQRRRRRTVGIACGEAKGRAMVSALRAKLFNAIVVDEGLAQCLLELQRVA